MELLPYLLKHVLSMSIIFIGGIALLTIIYVRKQDDVQHYVFIAKISIADFALMATRNVIAYAAAPASMGIDILKCNIVTIKSCCPVVCVQMIIYSSWQGS